MTFKQRAVSGVKWSTISQVGRQVAQLLTTIILARLLAPSDFGIIGMATVVIGFAGIFKDLGTSAAIIQKQGLSNDLLSSIFWINAGFGTLSMVALFAGAPLIGWFYHDPRVIGVLQILSLSFFISGLSILQKTLLERSLAFRALAKVEISAVVCGAIVGISMALSGAGVWSLVFQTLTNVTLTTILLWLSSPWRPTWEFHWRDVKSISSYSLNLIGFNIFNYFVRNADYLLIGRYLGAQDLGYYTLAYRILLFPLQNISAVIGRVMFPAYSSIQHDNRRFCFVYLKIAATIAFITFPMMMGVLVLAEPFIVTVFGDNWQPVILLVMILAPVGLLQSIGTTTGAIYQAKGRTDWMFRWGIGAGIFITLAFVIGLQWGIVGVTVAYAIAVFSISYLSFAIPFRLIDLKVVRLLGVLWRPLLNSVIMFATILTFKAILPLTLSSVMVLNLSVVLGIVVYGASSWMINRKLLYELWDLAGLKKMVSHALL